MPDNYSIVREAILDKERVVAVYAGCRREMCPHALGTKSGRRQALFFQFGGESNSGLPRGGGWRCMSVDELSAITVQTGPWHTDERHSQPQTCIDVVDVEVAP